ncbi:MAG: tetratricopeptide repeat protein [Proteobacteria bacterium]|nr:tetratricopeptide repeat protein [Pseudomonadota bacterium]
MIPSPLFIAAEWEPAELERQGLDRLGRGSSDEAARYFRRLVTAEPARAAAHNNLGIALKAAGDPVSGLRSYRRAAALDACDMAALNNIANALAALGNRTDAIRVLDRVIANAPAFVEAYQNRGDTLRHLKRFDEARHSLRTALTLGPGLLLAHNSVAALALALGETRSAIKRFRRVLAMAPSAAAHSSLLFSLSYDEETTCDGLWREYGKWAARYARAELRSHKSRSNSPDPERRLRVGYVSADLRDHPVARNLIGLIAAHDRRTVEVFLYPEIRGADAMTDRFRSLADRWHPTQARSDAEVSELIGADAIDVLVFVAGHTGENRITVAARAPAPVQVSIYDLSTTGIDTMDASLTDAILHPETTKERFSERLARLPCLYLHEPPANAPPPGPLPSLSTGHVTFGSFNNPAKQGDGVYRLWARILSDVPGSRLLLKYRGVYAMPSLRSRILATFTQLGVTSERIEFIAEAQDRARHLSDLSRIDVALDPFPFNGCNTTFEALWMGVPVVTLAGERFLSRMGASFVHQIGLDELAADSADAYLGAAISLAGDVSRRVDLRNGLRPRLMASKLTDAVAHARAIEDIYRQLWRRWCDLAAR